MPKGTVIRVSASYDNTAANRNNPDPEQWVGWGERTVDEMAHAWMNVVYLNAGEYQALVAERRSRTAKAADENTARPPAGAPAARSFPTRVTSGQVGASVTGSFEGWYSNPDGSRSFLVGYLNRNLGQEVDVPIGPNNRIEPGGPDLGQPTHFLPGRQHGMFVVAVPRDFTPQQTLTWTLVANGQTTSIPLRLNNDYVVNPFSDIGADNTPPILQFARNGPGLQGPTATTATGVARTTTLSALLPLTLWVADDARYTSSTNAPQRNPPPPVRLTWSKYRGPGAVTFSTTARPTIGILQGGTLPFYGSSVVIPKFSEPGDYLLHVTANEYIGEASSGFLCCWTTAIVKVAVTP